MNTELILAKIEEEARQNAAEILKDAKEKAASAKEASEQRVAKDKQKVIKEAEKQGQELEEKMIRMAQLERGKQMLSLKQTVMNKAFDEALQTMEQLPAQELKQLFESLVLQAAEGTEILFVGEKNKGWFDETFVQSVNIKCAQQGKPGKISVSSRSFPNETGVVLSGEGTLVHCTLESILSVCRMDLEASVAAILFS